MVQLAREAESILGVANFRRDLTGLVASLGTFNPIDNQSELLSDPKTFNKRFKQLSDAIRMCFNAAGDIAIRDKRYLETFLRGYVNPIAQETYKTDNWALYKDLAQFANNGNKLTFPESRISLDIDCSGQFNFAATYFWVFKNGILLKPPTTYTADTFTADDYTIMNTAYGVRCFIKSSVVNPNDTINIVANRIFNTDKKSVKVTVASTATNSTYLVPVANLSTFYHDKYIKLYVKRNLAGSTTHTGYVEIPRENFVTSVDTTGTTLKIDVVNFNLTSGEVLHVLNSVYWWQYQSSGNTGTSSTWSNEVELSELQSDGSYRPLPFSTIEDFDVFFNGWHLTAGEHYTIIKGGSVYTPYRLKFLFTPPDNTNYRIDIYHNEAVTNDNDAIIIRKAPLDNNGLITVYDTALLPFTPKLGHWFLNDKHLSNKYADSKHRRIAYLHDIDSNKRVEYRLRIVSTLAIKSVLDFVTENLSEFDMIADLLGLGNIQNIAYADLPPIVLNPANLTFMETYNSGWLFYDTTTVAVEQFRAIVDFYNTNHIALPLILDSNIQLAENGLPMNIIGNMLVLDSNLTQSKVFTLDSNKIF